MENLVLVAAEFQERESPHEVRGGYGLRDKFELSLKPPPRTH